MSRYSSFIPNATVVLFLFCLYLVGLSVFRLFLSPLAKIPGPKIAALTKWYEFYFDVVQGGRYTWEIKKMHEQYGPIVRISPVEVHINDGDYYDEVYGGATKKRDKWAWSAGQFGTYDTVIATVPHDLHRQRRAALNPFFSKRAVRELEPTIRAFVETLCRKLKQFQKSREPVNLQRAYAALTMDIITKYAFQKSYETLEAEDFAPQWAAAIDVSAEAVHVSKHFPLVLTTMRSLPHWLVGILNPPILLLIRLQQDLAEQVQTLMNNRESYDYKGSEHPTVFHELLQSDLPEEEKSLKRFTEEGQTVIAAGQTTTAHFLNTTTFLILSSPHVLQKLKTELFKAIPDPAKLPSVQSLEQLPYLSAVITEGFRRSYGTVTRLQRISPDAPLEYNGYVIPAGTPMGMTAIFIHDDPKHFPEPEKFKPERWLDPEARNRLEKYIVNFGRGTRSCLGINLAHAEIHLTLAALFRRFDMQTYETTWADIEVAHDNFIPAPRKGSPGLRVKITDAHY